MKIIGKVFILLTVIALILVPAVGCPTPPPGEQEPICIWVANAGSNNVMKLDPSTGSVVTYAVGDGPSALAFDGANIWVANNDDDTVMKLSASNGAVLGTFPVGDYPRALAFDGANIWVANLWGDNVMKLSASNGAVLGTFPVGDAPTALAFDGANIWVANNDDDTVMKLRASDGFLLGTFPGGTWPNGLAFDGADIWVANAGSNNVMKLRVSDGFLLGTFPVGDSPRSLAFDGANIWVANVLDGTVMKLSASNGSLLGTYAVGTWPAALAFDGANIWVANAGSNNVMKLSASNGAVLGTFPVGDGPMALVVTACFIEEPPGSPGPAPAVLKPIEEPAKETAEEPTPWPGPAPAVLEPIEEPTKETAPEPTANAYLLEQAIDGTLYTGIISGTTNRLSKSTDGGYTWSATGAPDVGPIVAIATSPTDADVVYFATATNVYKSTNAAWVFGVPIAAPSGQVISALDVVMGAVGYVVVIGTTAADAADVFTWEEPSGPWQNQGFNAAMVAEYALRSGLDRVLAVAFAPDFSTSLALVAVGNEADPEQQTCLSVRSGGIPVWGDVIDNPAVSIIGDTVTLGDIAFHSDWSADPTTGYSNFFFSINGAAGGVYLFQGVKVPGNSVTTKIITNQVVTLDVAGPVASAAILAGLTNGTVIRNDGTNWLPVSIQPTGSDNTYVVLALDFTTSGKAWALVRGTAGGLSLTTDYGDTWSVIWP